MAVTAGDRDRGTSPSRITGTATQTRESHAQTRLPARRLTGAPQGRLRRLAAILAAIIIGLLDQAAIVPVAFAKMRPAGGPPDPATPAAPIPGTTVR